MDTSILEDLKVLLGIRENSEFDSELLMLINANVLALTQLGLPVNSGFYQVTDSAVWRDMCSDIRYVALAKQALHLRIKKVFDPPPTSFAQQALDDTLKEQEWRLYIGVDNE